MRATPYDRLFPGSCKPTAHGSSPAAGRDGKSTREPDTIATRRKHAIIIQLNMIAFLVPPSGMYQNHVTVF